jgi:hypothetical protein
MSIIHPLMDIPKISDGNFRSTLWPPDDASAAAFASASSPSREPKRGLLSIGPGMPPVNPASRASRATAKAMMTYVAMSIPF